LAFIDAANPMRILSITLHLDLLDDCSRRHGFPKFLAYLAKSSAVVS
jgi:hypothetical protein